MQRVWLHLSGTTYGTWLRGDPRSFRSRNHRDHARGDYKHPPPPGTYDALHTHARSLMKRPPVRLSRPARALACTTIVEALQFHGAIVRAACLDDHHFHVLAALPMPTGSSPWASSLHPPKRKDADQLKTAARHLMGIAKARGARALTDSGLVPRGRVWTRRTRITRVRDRDHLLAIQRYILDHAHQGAFVLTPPSTP